MPVPFSSFFSFLFLHSSAIFCFYHFVKVKKKTQQQPPFSYVYTNRSSWMTLGWQKQNEGFCGIIKLRGVIRLVKLLFAWRKAVNTLGQRGLDKITQTHNWERRNPLFEKSAHMLEVVQLYQPRVRVWKLPAAGALTRGASGRRVLAHRWCLGSSRTGNNWGQSSAQTELLYAFLGRQLGNWLYTC